MKKDDLNVRQHKFIDNLFKGMSQKKAYREAGYKSKSPDVEASKMVRNPKIIAEIEVRRKEINRRNVIRLSGISERALAEMLGIVKDGTIDDRVKLDAIKDILDRVGLKPPEKVELSGELGFRDLMRGK